MKLRKGESLRRLQEGHTHAEQHMLRNVWWPAFGTFASLHPEYEVKDFRSRYAARSFMAAYLDHETIHFVITALRRTKSGGPANYLTIAIARPS